MSVYTLRGVPGIFDILQARTLGRLWVSYLLGKARTRVESPDDEVKDKRGSPATEPTPPGDSREPIRRREEDEDWEVVREVREGNTEQFSVLIRRHQNHVYSVVYRILGSPEEAEEVANDVFTTAFHKIDSFRGQARFSSWLYRIASNQAINRLRKTRRKKVERSLDEMMETSGEKALDSLGTSVDSPAGSAEESEWMVLIDKSLAEIPDDFRTVIVLRDVEGFSYEEISEQMRLPLGTIKSRIHKGRALLQSILGKYR